ncbi:hypothetical protein A2962_00340 [Candidatus Woesebacteria bacterium RIFCSPLOWO2_01_FULL_39_61]|nr:MAG: hypothetical protein A2692_05550 [Candidatus Woesebacteria bacterium RIFCSPHIGHO2_01_FULL_39_95]OGM66341.1 MAG: hypothetical protein A2962_00340 [Candidatus Woesebacteria bacterium RIFCSPLOWO2_01_FULL_39_61]
MLKGNNKKRIEIELRSIFDKAKYDQLTSLLKKNARDLGSDDKDVFFFLLPKKVVKVVNNVSKKTAEIVIKLNRLGRGSSDFEEMEISIDPKDFDKAVRLFSDLNFSQIQIVYQKRHNFEYKGVSLALKYTNSWGYHLELEVLVSRKSQQKLAQEKIRKVAEELDVKIISEQKLTEFAKKIDLNYKKGIYTNK